jgi:uncharacterized protein (UPF0332 family)
VRRTGDRSLATWRELSRDSLRAAQLLLEEGHLRSSVSRAYYAAYCAVSDQLSQRGVSFAHGWNNPSHDQLPALVRNNLALAVNRRRQLSRAIRRLRTAREDADYRPGIAVDRTLALACVHDAIFVVETLEVSQ